VDQQEIARVLKDALKAIDEAGVPAELRPAALDKAVDLLVGAATGQPAASQRGGATGKQDPPPPPDENDADPLTKIAGKLGLTRDVVEEVYGLDEGELRIVVPQRKLGATKSAGAKQLALLWAAARQATTGAEWTESEEIREVAKDFGKFDSANFGGQIRSMDASLRFTGSGRSLKVKVNRKGWENAADLVTSLAGGE
jgi:hypothetical protein